MDGKEDRYYCKDCVKSYTHRNNLRRHVRSAHLSNRSIHKRPAVIFSCPETCCDYTSEKDDMLSHYEDDHNIEIMYENFTFLSMAAFEVWKNDIERKTIAQFVKVRQNRVNKGGTTKIDYICHRAGFSRLTGKNIRKTKKVGSNKINAFCPAKMKVTISPKGGVQVEFINTHVGHTMDLVRINLNKLEREEIAKKLAENTPFDCILNDIRNSITKDNLERVHLLTRSDLYNIELSYNLSHDCARHKSIPDGVESWVEEVQSKEAVVRFFKPQGKLLPNCPDLEEQDFVLVVMNDAQLDMLEKFGGDLICVDGTHSLGSVDYQLFTLLVINEMRQCFPCSFLVTSRSDETALYIFFTVLRESLRSLKPIKPNVFMSDIEDAFYDAWNCAMLAPTTRLYCSWHVDRDWRLNLQKINSKNKQAEVYKKMRILLDERDVINFNIMLNQVFEEMETDPDTVSFAEYFSQYKDNPQTWASCYRQDTGLDSVLHLERMHKTLKYIYNRGKGVKRLDKVMHAIMRFVKDKLFDQFAMFNKANITSALREVVKRHKAAAELSSSGAEVEQDGDSWVVLLKSNTTVGKHKVTPAHPDCLCKLRCDSCSVCIHAFVCSCPDSSIRWNMCRHIHLVCQALRSLPALLPTLQLTTSTTDQEQNTTTQVIVASPTQPELTLTQEDKDKWAEVLENPPEHITIATNTITQDIHMTETNDTPVQVVVTPDTVSQQLVVTTTSDPNHMVVTTVTAEPAQTLEMVSESSSTPQMDLMTNVTEAYILQELKATVMSDHDYTEISSYKDRLKTEICSIIESADSIDELNLLEKLMSPISQTLSAYRAKHFCCHVPAPTLETKTYSLHL
ncbi:uncharacterized protein [Rhodnius prolixus]|uniref:SWIM-type domain-containing protein n=1 Tax=Rhodnius prolixus TaxID=13249 RepID=T1HDI0_RHOPR